MQAFLLSEDKLKVPSHLRKKDATDLIDFIDLVLLEDGGSLDNHSSSVLLQKLRQLCAEYGFVPDSCYLPSTAVTNKSRQPVATGGFGDVWLGELISENQWSKVALKRIRISGDNLEQLRTGFFKEVVTWRHLVHPNVVPFLGILDSQANDMCILSRWMENGSLVDFLKTNPGSDRLALIRNVTTGLEYLHSQGVVHGDLKGVNILIDGNGVACLTDFGLATVICVPRSIGGRSFHTTTSLSGTVRWMAPEILDPEAAGLEHARPSCEGDIYALSMVMWETFTGRVPFDECPRDAMVILKIISGHRPSRPDSPDLKALGLSDQIWQLMEKCWSREPKDRPCARSVMEDLPVSKECGQDASLE
ncbi:kinase-like protein [Laetiporus sulphureus 93-53]|uniref:Kinase-like protein n=1 Tax=Laetiporus sulphureus 93-53 TaxID=1314785 RepID=A0A165CPD2_9APHY|nr:kinase-like protein [Laetiporus sulphureus 93-53]KZT03176.1 kinase-like protein [Laetiporus sulphureus 93-53]